MGSQNCVTSTNACGVSGAGGPTVAVSENLFGVTGGAGAGPACGECWSLTTDSGTNLVVKVNNLCPIQGNELCNMQTLQDTNKEGMSAFSVGVEGLRYQNRICVLTELTGFRGERAL